MAPDFKMQYNSRPARAMAAWAVTGLLAALLSIDSFDRAWAQTEATDEACPHLSPR